MKITTTQKVIRIGTSAGVTIPSKELKRAGVKPGDEILFHFEPAAKIDPDTVELVELTQQLIARHEAALKNLSQR